VIFGSVACCLSNELQISLFLSSAVSGNARLRYWGVALSTVVTTQHWITCIYKCFNFFKENKGAVSRLMLLHVSKKQFVANNSICALQVSSFPLVLGIKPCNWLDRTTRARSPGLSQEKGLLSFWQTYCCDAVGRVSRLPGASRSILCCIEHDYEKPQLFRSRFITITASYKYSARYRQKWSFVRLSTRLAICMNLSSPYKVS